MASPGIHINFDVDPLIERTKRAELALHQHQSDLLDILGQMLLAQVQQAYVTKSRGGTGEDGIQWDGIQLGSLLARMRRVGHISAVKKTQTGAEFQVKKSNKANSAVFGAIVKIGAGKVVASGKGKGKFGTGTTIGLKKGRKTGTVAETLKKIVSPTAGGYEIGRDTGKQINTLQPGKSGDAGPSILVESNTVTVGAAMSYSPHFDRQRPIIPEHLPQKWLDELQEQATEYAAEIVEVELNK
jgi:hypothetical protein